MKRLKSIITGAFSLALAILSARVLVPSRSFDIDRTAVEEMSPALLFALGRGADAGPSAGFPAPPEPGLREDASLSYRARSALLPSREEPIPAGSPGGTLEGGLARETVSVKKGTASELWTARIDKVELRNEKGEPSRGPAFARETWLVERSPTGDVTAFYLAAEEARDPRWVLTVRKWLALSRWVHQGTSTPRWETRETEGRESRPFVYRWVKAGASAPWLDKRGETGDARLLSSLQVDPATGLPARLTAFESTRISLGDQLLSGTFLASEQRLLLETRSTRRLGPDELAPRIALAERLRKGGTRFEMSSEPPAETEQRPGSAPLAGSARGAPAATVGEILGERLDPRDLGPTELALRELLRAKPDQAAALVARIKGLDPRDPLTLAAVRALAGAGCASCQAGLLELIRGHQARGYPAVESLGTLAFLKKPIPEVASFLKEQAQEGRDPFTTYQARLSLGAVSRSLAQNGGDTAWAEAVGTETFERLSASVKAGAPDLTALNVLTNLGGTHAGDGAALLMRNEDEGVRAQAYQALRFVPGDGALRSLESGLRDPSERVRISATRTLGYRDDPAVAIDALDRRYGAEPSPAVRMAAIETVSGVRERTGSAAAVRFLERIAASEAEAELRELASQAAQAKMQFVAGP
jgi:hypothetical protein